jgi:hypothetical protein
MTASPICRFQHTERPNCFTTRAIQGFHSDSQTASGQSGGMSLKKRKEGHNCELSWGHRVRQDARNIIEILAEIVEIPTSVMLISRGPD